MQFKESFRKYLEEAIGPEKARVAFSAFDLPASVSVRLNPSKGGTVPEVLANSKTVEWSACGHLLAERPVFTLDPAFHQGRYYVQDSSSMFVGELFRRLLRERFADRTAASAPLKVLDLCAAPGGKTTDLAASLREFCGDNFLLVANEVMKQRVQVLADNVALWGDPNVVVTSDDPADFGRLSSFFDLILADVPCSGEGMFRKDAEAVAQWSEDNVALCQARQRRIIADVWPALAQGGVLVYSTCTFNRYENDCNVGWMRDSLGAVLLRPEMQGCDDIIRTEFGFSLVPGFVPGEGQYCAAVVKSSASDPGLCEPPRQRKQDERRRQNDKAPSLPEGVEKLFGTPVSLYVKSDLLIAVPKVVDPFVKSLETCLRIMQKGCAVGTLKGRDLVPSADLALCTALAEDAFPKAELTEKEALAFLHKDAIYLPGAPKGIVAVCFEGHPLGFVKNLGNRCNNLHPQSRRIRMDIK